MYAHIPNHPVIRNMETWGFPDGPEPPGPSCPECGSDEPSRIYDGPRGLIGCDRCVDIKDAAEALDTDDPRCPECGAACETVYIKDGAIKGCDACVTERDPWDIPECRNGQYF